MKKIALFFLAITGLLASSQTTQISTFYCGHTATSTTEFIWADSLGLPTTTNNDRYNFKLINGTTTLTWTTNNQWPIMQWYLISGFVYNTTYTASVSWSSDYGSTFGTYGSTCIVISPSFPTTSLTPTYCGSSPSGYNSLIYAEAVSVANNYEYRLINASLSYNQSFVKTNQNFILSQFTGLQNNTTYSVDVRVKVNNVWGNFGNVCDIITPPAPTTSIIGSECGTTATSYTSQLFHCEAVLGFQCYYYNFTDGVNTYTLEKCNNNNFILSQLTPTIPVGTTCTVTVKVKFNNIYGPFGNACTITTPATYQKPAYPNPFNESTEIVIPNNKSEVIFKVYDRNGKLVEQIITKDSNVKIGEKYPEGIYNVIIIDNNKVINSKIIKQ